MLSALRVSTEFSSTKKPISSSTENEFWLIKLFSTISSDVSIITPSSSIKDVESAIVSCVSISVCKLSKFISDNISLLSSKLNSSSNSLFADVSTTISSIFFFFFFFFFFFLAVESSPIYKLFSSVTMSSISLS